VSTYGYHSIKARHRRRPRRIRRILRPYAQVVAIAITMWALGTVMSMARGPYQLDRPAEEPAAPAVRVTTILTPHVAELPHNTSQGHR
jgi:hypothetical protein